MLQLLQILAGRIHIPTIVTTLGVVLAVMINWSNVTLEAIVGSALSGLPSTGQHQLFKR